MARWVTPMGYSDGLLRGVTQRGYSEGLLWWVTPRGYSKGLLQGVIPRAIQFKEEKMMDKFGGKDRGAMSCSGLFQCSIDNISRRWAPCFEHTWLPVHFYNQFVLWNSFQSSYPNGIYHLYHTTINQFRNLHWEIHFAFFTWSTLNLFMFFSFSKTKLTTYFSLFLCLKMGT